VTQEQFNKLTDNERLNLVWDQGEFIAQRLYYSTAINLFLFDTFFVEVFFEPEQNEVSGVIVQAHSEILYGYVCDLDLAEITNLLT
jgi:hypothetical protein